MSRAIRSPLALALVALGLLLVALEVARPGYFTNDDNATWFAGAYAHDFRTLTQTGRLAEVNFYQYGGEPFLEQGQTGVLYPPVYIAAVLAERVTGDLRGTMDWLTAMHLMLALAGFYAWLRQGGVEARLAALGGLTWALNPFVLLLGASWIVVTAAAAWLPWLFWAMDRLFARPTAGSGLALGIVGGIFVLQGSVQWTAYAMLFSGMYAGYRIFTLVRIGNGAGARPLRQVAGAFLWGGAIAAALALPLLQPMSHAADESLARAQPLPITLELFYHVDAADLLAAQAGFFRPNFFFDASSALLFCPALVLAPLALAGFLRGDADLRRRLFPLLVLAVIALILCGRGYFLLNVLPLMQKFRWPFKLFLFAEFFLIASLVWSIAAWRGRAGRFSPALLAIVLALQVVFSVARHDQERLSPFRLPTTQADLPPGMDPSLGRVIAVDDEVPAAINYRYFTHQYGTWYQVPSLGGYNPLASQARSDFGHRLDVPNLWVWPITARMRSELESRAVRYWIVDPKAAHLLAAGPATGLRMLEGKPDRLVFEDLNAQPIAYDTAAPTAALPVRYAGNSMLIRLGGGAGSIAVSVGPTDGWRCRVDGGPWETAEYHDNRLYCAVAGKSRELEVSYFDARFRNGIRNSLIIMVVLLLCACVRWIDFRRLSRSP